MKVSEKIAKSEWYGIRTVEDTLGTLVADNYRRAFGFADVEYIEKIHVRMANKNVLPDYDGTN